MYPKWIHKPVYPEKIDYKSGCQNTDPYVFGENFKYFICKQVKNEKETQLSKLDSGDIILFGSAKKELNSKGKSMTKENSFFQLDTVFVISHFIDYDTSDIHALQEENVPREYREIVFKTAFPNPDEKSLKLRLYFGANFEKSHNGMYSFSPAIKYEHQEKGFERLKIKDFIINSKYSLTNNINSSPKIISLNQNEIKDVWKRIKELTKEAGLLEGVKFEITNKDEE